jgi:hypothetical protein
MQQRLTAVLMRHGRIWRGRSTWTVAHRQWIAGQVFDEPALKGVVATYRVCHGQSIPHCSIKVKLNISIYTSTRANVSAEGGPGSA